MSISRLSYRFEQAMQVAVRLHGNQLRKGTRIPYVAHLLAVAALVLEDGGDEDQAIAALLHDAPEDQGGRAALEQIRTLFGEHVAQLVDGCTDSYDIPKPPWRQRKENYLAHLPSVSSEVQRISLADKLHNARSILADLRLSGNAVWKRFTGGKEGTLWYYKSLVQVFQALDPSPMSAELSRVLLEIERLAASLFDKPER
jgi:(p)ppGpp synthase/HD superfamily hydrolase